MKRSLVVSLVLIIAIGSLSFIGEITPCQNTSSAANTAALDPSLVLGQDNDNDGIDDMLFQIPLGEIFLVVYFDGPVHNEQLDKLDSLDVQGSIQTVYSYRYLDAVRIYCRDLDVSDLETIRDLPGVISIQKHPELKPFLDVSVPAIKASPSTEYSPTTASELGLTGNGVVVAVTDTGVDDVVHQSLRGKFVQGCDFSGLVTVYNTNPDDENGHGTHCASTAVGTGGNGERMGVAPGAELVDLKISTAIGGSIGSNLDEALEWCIDNHDLYGISVISTSFGSQYNSNGRDTTSLLVNEAVNAGITVCIAIGNDGTNIVPSPAAADLAITVGATDDKGTIDRTDDSIAGYSNYGLRSSDGDSDKYDEMKPDVTAPGTNIMAAGYNSLNAYVSKSGTSMACPHVAGLCALMKEALPDATPDELKDQLHRTSEARGTPSQPALDPKYNTRYGWGLVDAFGSTKGLLDIQETSISGPEILNPTETGIFTISMPYTRTPYITAQDKIWYDLAIPEEMGKPYDIRFFISDDLDFHYDVAEPYSFEGQWLTHGYIYINGSVSSIVEDNISVSFSTDVPFGFAGEHQFSGYLKLNELREFERTHGFTVTDAPPAEAEFHISEIEFSNPLPAQGEFITITGIVNNSGFAFAPDVMVNITDGPIESGVPIFSDRIDIDAYGTGSISAQWQATPGDHNIFVTVDPMNEFPEASEDNNTANRHIIVRGFNPAPEAVLTVTPSDALVKESVGFDGSDSYDSDLDGSGAVTQYLFNFGDGMDSGWTSLSKISHSYDTPGTYTASLKVKDNGGVESDNNVQVQVNITKAVTNEAHLYLVGDNGLSETLGDTVQSVDCPDGRVQGGGVVQWADLGVWTYPEVQKTILLRDTLDIRAALQNTGTQDVFGAYISFEMTSGGEDLYGEGSIGPIRINASETCQISGSQAITGSIRIPFLQDLTLKLRCKVGSEDLKLLYGDTANPSGITYHYAYPNLYPPAVSAGDDIQDQVERDIFFNAQVTDPDSDIINYTWDFGDGSTYVSESSPEIYHSYSNIGNYKATLTVLDTDGLLGQDLINVTIDPKNTIPSITILSPGNNSKVSGLVNVSGRASDPEGLDLVELRVNNGPWQRAEGTSSWTFLWDSTLFGDGPHIIYARAYDGLEHSLVKQIWLEVDNALYPPVVTEVVVYPDPAMRGIDILFVEARVSDQNGYDDLNTVTIDLKDWMDIELKANDKGLKEDEVFGDGVFTCSYPIPDDAPTGNFEIRVLAVDMSGLTGEASKLTTISDPEPGPVIVQLDVSPEEFDQDGVELTIQVLVDDPEGLDDITLVFADLGEIDGPSVVEMNDLGLDGDEIAGDGIFTTTYFVRENRLSGSKTIVVSVTDRSGLNDEAFFQLYVYDADEEDDEQTTGSGGFPILWIMIGGAILILICFSIFLYVVRKVRDGLSGPTADIDEERTGADDEDMDIYEARIVEDA